MRRVIDELIGVIITFDEEQVEVRFDGAIEIIFPSTLFRDQPYLLSKGMLVKYQVLEKENGEQIERFIAHKENATEKNKDVFDLWDSIPTK